MSGYGSPSLAKMEASARHYRARPRFRIDRILGEPFALSTITIAIAAWIITFIAGVVSAVNGKFLNIAWWAIAFFFVCILAVSLAVALDLVLNYHVAITAFLSYALFLSTAVIDNAIYQSAGSQQAAAAGFILLSAVTVIWIFYFGTQSAFRHRGLVDTFALQGAPNSGSRHASNLNHFGQNTGGGNNYQSSNGRLHGLETSSPQLRYPDAPSTNPRASPAPQGQPRGFGTAPTSPQYNTNNPFRHSVAQTGTGTGTGAASSVADDSVAAPTEYPYRARAIYSYEANPEDANEITFAKHEILEVSDVSGRWWQARKANNETGIAPSNYLILL